MLVIHQGGYRKLTCIMLEQKNIPDQEYFICCSWAFCMIGSKLLYLRRGPGGASLRPCHRTQYH
jgi:hypothetical protein